MEQSSWSRLIGVLTAPEKTFRSIAEKPTWAVVLIVLIALGVGVGVLMTGKIDWAEVTRDSIEARGQDVPEEQLERIIDFQEKFGPVFVVGGPLVVGPLIYLLLAVVFLVVLKLMSGEIDFKRSFSVVLHSMMPQAVSAVLSIPVVLGKDEFSAEDLQDGSVLTSNLSALAPEEASPALISMLSSLDLFSIWVLVLLVIGYSTVARVSKGKVTVGVVTLWVLYVLGKVGLASLSG